MVSVTVSEPDVLKLQFFRKSGTGTATGTGTGTGTGTPFAPLDTFVFKIKNPLASGNIPTEDRRR